MRISDWSSDVCSSDLPDLDQTSLECLAYRVQLGNLDTNESFIGVLYSRPIFAPIVLERLPSPLVVGHVLQVSRDRVARAPGFAETEFFRGGGHLRFIIAQKPDIENNHSHIPTTRRHSLTPIWKPGTVPL